VSAFKFDVDGDAFKGFQKELKAMNNAVAKELNAEFRDVIRQHVLPDAKANASWSSRIPGAIKPQVTQRLIGLRVARKQAPHGRPYEGLQTGARGRSTFRHPVFGNRKVWVSQNTRPFLQPAMDDNREEAVEAAKKAVVSAAERAGFK
jgi:hypothetical protein